MANLRAMASAGFFGLFMGATVPAMVYGICWIMGFVGVHDKVVIAGVAAAGIIGLIVVTVWGSAVAQNSRNRRSEPGVIRETEDA